MRVFCGRSPQNTRTIKPHHGNIHEREYPLLDRLKVSKQLLVSVHIGHFFGCLL